MSGRNIAFDVDEYDRLIRALTALIGTLQSATGSDSPLPVTGVLLQPTGQTWAPAQRLVAAGRSFFDLRADSVDGDLLPRLTGLRDRLVQARSLFQDVEELSAVSRADFMGQMTGSAATSGNG